MRILYNKEKCTKMIWVYRFTLTPILTLSPENYVSTIIFFLNLLSYLHSMSKKKNTAKESPMKQNG